MKSDVSRADLMRCYACFGDDHLEQFAVYSGYALKKETRQQPQDKTAPARQPTKPTLTPSTTDNTQLSERYYAITQRIRLDEDRAQSQTPAWYEDAEPFTHAVKAKRALAPPQKPPLMRWARLWPFVKAMLSGERSSRQLDCDRIVAHISSGRIVKRLPYRPKQTWASAVHVIVDYSPRLACFWSDFNALCNAIVRLYGHASLQLFMFEQGPSEPSVLTLIILHPVFTGVPGHPKKSFSFKRRRQTFPQLSL